MPKTLQDNTPVRVKTTPPFKLKDRRGRSFQVINLQKQFGFLPETIVVEKIPGSNNGLIVRAILTPDEIKKEDQAQKTQDTPG